MRFIITARPGPDSSEPPDPNGPFDEALFSAYMDSTRRCTSRRPRRCRRAQAGRATSPASKAKKGKRSVVDGPFTESKELVGGFYIIEVDSQEEAIEWALRCPTGLGFDDVLEIRALTGESDLPPHLLELIYKAAPTWSATFSKKR